jgi:hypothetical protein
MPENMQENQVCIDPKDLFGTIGEMTVELRMIRIRAAELQQENEKLRKHHKELIKQANTGPAAVKGD